MYKNDDFKKVVKLLNLNLPNDFSSDFNTQQEYVKRTEHSFLAACVNIFLEDGSEELLREVFTLINPEYFFYSPHAKIYQAIQDCLQENIPHDLLSIASKFDNPYDKKDTLINLVQMLSQHFLESVHIMFYAEKVRDLFKKRQLRDYYLSGFLSCINPLSETDTTITQNRKMLDNIEAYTPKKSCNFSDILDQTLAETFDTNNRNILATGWSFLNDKLVGGFMSSELTILAGRTGTGKTAMAVCLALDVAKQDKPVLFVSREMGDKSIAARLLSRESGVNNKFYRQGVENKSIEGRKLREASERLKNLPLHILEKSNVALTVGEIRRVAKSISDISLVIVDYLQLVTPEKQSGSREQDISSISRQLKLLAMELNIPIIALSQLSRSVDKEKREPRLSDLRESGAIEQDADIIMFLSPKDNEINDLLSSVKLIIAKSRSTATGNCYFSFDKTISNFERGEFFENVSADKKSKTFKDFQLASKEEYLC